MKQTTTATVLADNAANVPTTLVSYLQRLKSLDETSISVSDKVHSKVESFVLALTANKKRKSKRSSNNNNEVFDDDDNFDDDNYDDDNCDDDNRDDDDDGGDYAPGAPVAVAEEH